MAIVVVLFNLNTTTDVSAYEEWARSTDLPTVNALPSVNKFTVLKAQGTFSGEASPYQYIEIIDVADMDQLTTDVSTSVMQEISKQFQEFADNPTFIVSESL
jgi:hypothetical protein